MDFKYRVYRSNQKVEKCLSYSGGHILKRNYSFKVLKRCKIKFKGKSLYITTVNLLIYYIYFRILKIYSKNWHFIANKKMNNYKIL